MIRKTSPTGSFGERAQDISEAELEAQLIEYFRQKLAGYKRPRSVVFVNSLPRNVMGKLLKRELREQYGYPIDAE